MTRTSVCRAKVYAHRLQNMRRGVDYKDGNLCQERGVTVLFRCCFYSLAIASAQVLGLAAALTVAW